MDRDEVFLREKIRILLETYTFEELLEENELELEDVLLFLIDQYDFHIPEMEPLS